MIVKDTDTKSLNNKYLKSGFKAEQDMSFYLRRTFGDADYIYVINDLRLELGDDHAQIDHLVIHRFGFIVIESKSVSSKVCVNQHGEWKRIFNDKETGMPSPIQQAKRQGEFLKKFLMTKNSSELFRESLANKYAPSAIEKFDYDVLVAISDSGIIERDKIELPEICKADSITDRIDDIISRHHKEFTKILTISIKKQFHQDSIKKLSNLLVESHCSLNKKKEEIDIVEEKQPECKNNSSKTNLSSNESRKFDKDEIYLCKHCKSPNLEIKNGQYNFYFKCLFCHKNTSLQLVCSKPTKLCKPTLEKRGLSFFRVCKVCKDDKLFFTNANTSKDIPALKKEEPMPENDILKDTQKEVCNKCNSENIQIAYGKFGYYFKCKDCDANRKPNLVCKKSSCKPKLKKEKEKFYKVCNDCDVKELFFTNTI